jgi:hypothetical protein
LDLHPDRQRQKNEEEEEKNERPVKRRITAISQGLSLAIFVERAGKHRQFAIEREIDMGRRYYG